MDQSEYWEFSVWFLHNYGTMILEPHYEAMQLAAYHAWVASRIELKRQQELLGSYCDHRR
jgi:hypothetical protein